MTSDNNGLEKIEVESFENNISETDLEFYYLKEIHKRITEDFFQEKSDKYTIMVYYKILHDIGFEGEYIVNWNTKIKFKPLLNEKRKNTVSERIIAVDCEVSAKSLSHARGKAMNITKDFVAYLSLLIDIGFFEVQSKFTHYIRKSGNFLMSEFQRNDFFDEELKLIVMDNMNGLRHVDDYNAIESLSYFSFHTLKDGDVAIENSYIENNSDELNERLKDTFLNLTINKSKTKNKYRETICVDPVQTSKILLPRQIRKYYKGIMHLTGEKARYFNNCCRLYNIAQTCGVYEPTLLLAYMVSSVECLAKSENLSFSKFMETYLAERYDKELADFLYGNLRSGHFHAGEVFFTEYNLTLDISLDRNYQKKANIYFRSKSNLRQAMISWIEENILNIEK